MQSFLDPQLNILHFNLTRTTRLNCDEGELISEPEWAELRRQVLERDGSICQWCGFHAQSWQNVHHVDGNPTNNDLSNLETICCMCHRIMHIARSLRVGEVELWELRRRLAPEELSDTQREIIRNQRSSMRDKGLFRYGQLRRDFPLHRHLDDIAASGLMSFFIERRVIGSVQLAHASLFSNIVAVFTSKFRDWQVACFEPAVVEDIV